MPLSQVSGFGAPECVSAEDNAELIPFPRDQGIPLMPTRPRLARRRATLARRTGKRARQTQSSDRVGINPAFVLVPWGSGLPSGIRRH